MDTKELLKITLGLNNESTYKSINLSEIHSLLICGGTSEARKAFLDNIRFGKLVNMHVFNSEAPESAVEGLEELAEQCQVPAVSKDECHHVVIVNDYAQFILPLSKAERDSCSRIKKAIDTIAQKGKAYDYHIILVNSRPCVDVVTNRLKSLFAHRIMFKSNRIDSMTVIGTSSAANLPDESSFIYTDGAQEEVLSMEEACSQARNE